ncbi:MAG TPA: hypothetical protein VF432_30325 [Thermoanaerobaculia bacterium]
MNTTHDLQLPSGSEVESATWHPPVHESLDSGFRGRLDTWKSRGLSKVHDVQRNVQRVVADRSAVIQTGAKTQVTKVQDSMRTSPMKWAGIAAGTGFALGLMGRIAQARNKRKHAMPTLVIVEAGC